MKKIRSKGCFSLTALLLTVLLIAGCLSAPVGADGWTATRVTAYDYDLGTTTANLTVEQMINNISGQEPKPVIGVEYTAYRIGDLFNIQTGSKEWQTGYGILESVANTLGIAGFADGSDSNYFFYTNAGAQQSINEALEGKTNVTLSGITGEKMITGKDGKATAALDFGLYLLVQSNIDDAKDINGDAINIVEPQSPLIFPLPQGKSGDWQTNVTISAKSGLVYEKLDKKVIGSDGTQQSSATASPGDVLQFKLTINPPVMGEYETLTAFSVEDVLTKGLEFKRILSVTDIRGQTYQEGADYQLTIKENLLSTDLPQDQKDAVGGTRVLLQFTQQGLQKVEALRGQELYVEYTALVTEADATNSARMNYDSEVDPPDNPPTNPPTNPPDDPPDRWKETNRWDVVHSYSFGVRLQKYLGDQNTPANGSVVFELYRGEDKQPVLLEQQEDGSYIVSADAASNRLSVDAGGRFTLYGLAEDTYYLREIQTADGYALPDEDICITLCGEQVNGEYTGRLDVTRTLVDGQMGSASIEDDLIKLSVVNPRTMYIPNTGSMESWMFTAGGLLVIVVGVVYLVLSRRKGRS
ncbi:SpaH/EbpB family LPXTG-anchored major pilin [uncultured Negativibacillus sp.]|uniref:SpaH/EbpB family LPXTG-anchored major pilin n=1 Tax=uncultured Negativibacillus sp. TaxID=1980696 RepID=UPI0025D5F1D2|nr:SpaH/EbpB family LPXTG-anchored major pilin [uncultured Negativibacillus sp.]